MVNWCDLLLLIEIFIILFVKSYTQLMIFVQIFDLLYHWHEQEMKCFRLKLNYFVFLYTLSHHNDIFPGFTSVNIMMQHLLDGIMTYESHYKRIAQKTLGIFIIPTCAYDFRSKSSMSLFSSFLCFLRFR